MTLLVEIAHYLRLARIATMPLRDDMVALPDSSNPLNHLITQSLNHFCNNRSQFTANLFVETTAPYDCSRVSESVPAIIFQLSPNYVTQRCSLEILHLYISDNPLEQKILRRILRYYILTVVPLQPATVVLQV